MANQLNSPKQLVVLLQLLTAGMTGGLVIFGVIAFVITEPAEDAMNDCTVSLVLAGIALPMLIASFLVVSRITPESVQKRLGEQQASGSPEMIPHHVMAARTIARCGLLEAAAIMNIVAYILEGCWWSLGVAGFAVLIIASLFPTKTKFDQYAETQKTFNQQLPG